jgi:hypothetical protein
MCAVLLPPGVKPIAVHKYIIILSTIKCNTFGDVSRFITSLHCQRPVENTPKIRPGPPRPTRMEGKCPNHWWWWWLCMAKQSSIGPWPPVLHNSRHAIFYGERLSPLAQPGRPGHRIYNPRRQGGPPIPIGNGQLGT